MSVIRVTASTMGVSSPASVAAGTGYYRYKRDPDWSPNDPRYRRREEPVTFGPAASSADRAARFAEFCRYREDGASIAAAGRLIDVAPRTARTYERQREALMRQQGEGQ